MRRGARSSLAGLAGLAALVLVACSGSAPTLTYVPPSGSAGTTAVAGTTPSAGVTAAPTATSAPSTAGATASPGPTPARSAGATARPTASPEPATGWDPRHVAVTFTAVATVPGRPLAIANAGDGSDRLFVAEQGGKVYAVSGGTVAATPFLDLSGAVSGGAEQGLLGLAFHPGFPTDNRVFVDYTDRAGNTVVSSFRVDPTAPATVEAGSEVAILNVTQPYANHNGGGIAFGPDGDLYVALGDGGSGGDPQNNGQSLSTLLGKILRIDVDHAAGGRPYAIPASNPFASTAGARGEIWLYGLRNPFRFSFDRATGDLWIGDVGQNAWEEVDVARAGVGGLNLGWRIMEGDHCYDPATGCSTAGLTLPVTEYPHTDGCAIIGGDVYRGSASPALRGGYLFIDECSGFTGGLDPAASGAQPLVKVASGPTGVAGFGESESGELYAADLDGHVYRVAGSAR